MPSPTPPSSSTDPTITRLLSLIASQTPTASSPATTLAHLGTPSTSLAILTPSSLSTHCISTLPHTPHTAFQACSVSKSLAALATLRLVQAGSLSLSAPITTYLPPARLATLAPTPTARALLPHVTVHHLLSHSAGLGVPSFPGYGAAGPAQPRLADVLGGQGGANTLPVRLEGLPGQTFAYSGGGYAVLQAVLERVTGRPFAEVMQTLVFAPLGMTRSFYGDPDAQGREVACAYYTGFTACEDRWRGNPEAAAAGAWSTPADLLRAVGAVQESLRGRRGPGEGEGKTFLSQELARLLLTEVGGGMALGWMAPRDPGTAFAHPGSNWPGYRCFVVGYADLGFASGGGDWEAEEKGSGRRGEIPEGCGICVMTNSAQGETVLHKVVAAVAWLKGWPPLPAFWGYEEALVPFAAPEAVVDLAWKGWMGVWLEEGRARWVLEEDDEKNPGPAVRYEGLPAVRLLVAAIPAVEYEDGIGVDLVLEGLEVMFRLGWRERVRAVMVWHGGSGQVSTLKRSDV